MELDYRKIRHFGEPTKEQIEEIQEEGYQLELKEYNEALEKLSEALENLNQNFKDKLADAKSAHIDLLQKINRNKPLF